MTACNSGSFQLSRISQSSSLCSSSELHVCMPCIIGCQGSSVQTAQCTAQQDITCNATSAAQPTSSPPPPPSP
eukprot:c11569_g1_i1 orf=1-216(-)